MGATRDTSGDGASAGGGTASSRRTSMASTELSGARTEVRSSVASPPETFTVITSPAPVSQRSRVAGPDRNSRRPAEIAGAGATCNAGSDRPRAARPPPLCTVNA